MFTLELYYLKFYSLNLLNGKKYVKNLLSYQGLFDFIKLSTLTNLNPI